MALGSDVFLATSIGAISLLVLLLLRYYLPLRTTPAYILLPIFLALALPGSIILLVPIDLASAAVPEDGNARGINLGHRTLLVFWRITYWLIFVLTWFVLPLLADYTDAGQRDPRGRLMYSLRSNAKYQAIILGSGILGLIYVFLQVRVDAISVKATIMALAYAWGLILAIYLMGNGLVAIPRSLYRSASIAGRLKGLQAQAPKVHDRLSEAIEELDQLELQVLQLRGRKNGTVREFQDWIEELADTSDLPESRAALAPSARVLETNAPNVITERYLADLTRKLKRARHKRIRHVEEWDRLVRDAADAQAILDAASSQRLHFGSPTPQSTWLEKLTLLTPFTRYLLHAQILPAIRLFFSGILALASACIIWSEIFKSVVPQICVVGLSIVHHPKSADGRIGFSGQIMAACWLLYMCAAALTSVTEVKVWGNRALVRRHTYAESACWYACQVAKLTVPLSYNFITFVPEQIYKDTAFYDFLGELINLTPLGRGFSAFFPVLILVPSLAAVFNLYGRIKKIAGFDVFDDEFDDNPSSFGTGTWREGRTLIEGELNGNTALGLSSRTHSPLGRAQERQPSAAPFADATSDSTLLSSSTASSTVAAAAPSTPQTPRADRQRTTRTLPLDEPDDGNFMDDFTHRVRNTLDTMERPEWVRNINISRPKWLGGVEGNTESSGRADSGRGLGRWFGGRPEDGRVRL